MTNGETMDFGSESSRIPGTILTREKMGNVTGEEFLDKIFYISDHVMLAQIREIAGVDGSTLQNWLKRGWVASPVNKMYTRDQLARILIINMLRDTMQLCDISFLLTYVNGDPESSEDDIIPESRLYGYICRILDHAQDISLLSQTTLASLIDTCIADYEEKFSGARKRLLRAIEIIMYSYLSNITKRYADQLIHDLRNR